MINLRVNVLNRLVVEMATHVTKPANRDELIVWLTQKQEDTLALYFVQKYREALARDAGMVKGQEEELMHKFTGTSVQPPPTFEYELSALLNKHGKERGSNTADYVLAEYLSDCLAAFNRAARKHSETPPAPHYVTEAQCKNMVASRDLVHGTQKGIDA